MNILAFFAHPDDETMLAGGTLALLANAGMRVHYLCATRGEGGETGEPPLCEIEALGRLREAELVCAVQALAGRSLTFLDYTDPRVGQGEELYAYTDDLDGLAGQVESLVRRLKIDAIFTHGSNGEYGHPAHVFSHQAARKAIELYLQSEGRRPMPLLYTVQASFPGHPRPRLANKDDGAHLILDIRPAIDQKTRAALCHATQHALFVRRASEQAGRRLSVPEVIMSVESFHRALPPVNGSPGDPLADLLRQWETGEMP